jgi:uncharacterized protein (TIGR02266 family)
MAKKTILLADDTEFFLELEKTFFRREDFVYVTARNGMEALELVASAKPDIVFLDLYMPGMNGDECCRRIKSDPASTGIPVVMVTVSGKEADLERCRKAGCDDIILKPINRQHFIDTAKKYLNVQVRSFTRYMARLQLHYGQDNTQLLTDYTINLSTGGVFLETLKLMEVDTPLEAEFVLPNCTATIRCKARVAWVNHPSQIKNPNLPAGMGLQFINLRVEDMDAIRGYIRDEKLTPMW